MTLNVLDPRLGSEGEPTRMAPAIATLDGAVIGLLDNAKIGTARFYDHVEALLKSQFRVREVIRRRKPDASRPVPPTILGELSGADAILSGIGD